MIKNKYGECITDSEKVCAKTACNSWLLRTTLGVFTLTIYIPVAACCMLFFCL